MKSFISVVISEHIIHLIFQLMTYNMTYLKFLFLDSFLSGSLGGWSIGPSWVYWYSRHLCLITGGSIGQSWVTDIQGISAQFPGGPFAKVCLSAKYEHTSKLLLNNFQCNCPQEIHSHFGGPLAKVGLSANFGVLVFKASLL